MITQFTFAALALISHASTAHARPAATVWSRGSQDRLRAMLPRDRVKFVDQRSVAAAERRQGYLPAPERDALFRRLKLEQVLRPYDEVDKDLLVMFLRGSSQRGLVRIHRKYPNVSMNDLQRLRREVGKIK